MQQPSQRGLIIGLLFAFWLGAAALACGPFFNQPLGSEEPGASASSLAANSPVVPAPLAVTVTSASSADSTQSLDGPTAARRELPPAEMAASHSKP
ncbi:MAG: hypothetical protein M3O30_12955 [Planctomycetota bacterium]|nr:hypothetical protein [Planctomycetota bacterium]